MFSAKDTHYGEIPALLKNGSHLAWNFSLEKSFSNVEQNSAPKVFTDQIFLLVLFHLVKNK